MLQSDAALLERARAGVDALNLKYGASHADRFFLFHRDRQWNRGEHAWIGWERKRGKIEEFNRLLRGATDTSFSTQVGALDVLPAVRYCITLDSDTRLPRDAARRLIGIIAHPLHQRGDRPGARPRHVRLRHPAAARQRHHGQRLGLALRAHVCGPHRRRSLHDGRVRRVPGPVRRGHLHRQGPLRRGCVRRGARGPRARKRAAVARPLRRTLRPHRPGQRRRGGGRLPVERARTRPPPAPLGAGRLADPVVALPGRALACRARPATGCRSSRAGRSSTTCGAACCRRLRCFCWCSAGPCCRATRRRGPRWGWRPWSSRASPACCTWCVGRGEVTAGGSSCAKPSKTCRPPVPAPECSWRSWPTKPVNACMRLAPP